MIAKAIQSVFSQTFFDWELVIVDDGSKISQLPEMAVGHPRVKFIHQKHHGLSRARNTGINNSEGEYIAFLDADDYWEPGKLAAQVMALDETPSAGLCYTNFDIVDTDGKRLSSNGFNGGSDNYTELLHACCICVSSVMLRRSCLEELHFDENYTHAQDYDLWLSIARTWTLKYIPASEMHYCRHERQMSAQYMTVFREVRQILNKHLQAARRAGDRTNEEACYVGLAAARLNYAHQAFDVCRVGWRQCRPLLFALHLWNVLSISRSPGFIAEQAYAHIAKKWPMARKVKALLFCRRSD